MLAVLQPDGYVIVDKSGVAYQTQPTLPPKVVLADVDAQETNRCSAQVAVVATALPEKLVER